DTLLIEDVVDALEGRDVARGRACLRISRALPVLWFMLEGEEHVDAARLDRVGLLSDVVVIGAAGDVREGQVAGSIHVGRPGRVGLYPLIPEPHLLRGRQRLI